MTALVSYLCKDSIATITMDDGKVNVLSPQMLAELGAALDTAEREAGVVVLTGREGRFSGGFDLASCRAAASRPSTCSTPASPWPNGCCAFRNRWWRRATGMRSRWPCSCSTPSTTGWARPGAYRITANEVALGLTMPRAAVEICRQRLTPAHFHRAVSLAEVYSPHRGGRSRFPRRGRRAG